MRVSLQRRQQQWLPIGLARMPVAMMAALWPPEWLNRTNDLFWLSFTDAQFEPIPAGTSRSVTVGIPTQNHVIASDLVAVVTDGAGVLQATAPLTATLQDGTTRKLMNRALPLNNLFGPGWGAAVPGGQDLAFRKFFRAGSQLTLTVSNRGTVPLTVRAMLGVTEIYPV